MSRPTGMTVRAALLLLGALFLVPAPRAAEVAYTAASRQDPLGPNGASARAVALGSAFVGIADDSSALFWNPAGLALVPQTEIALHHLSGLAQIQQDTFAMAIPVGRVGALGMYGHFVDFGTFEGRDDTGLETASYKARQIALNAGWGRRVVGPLAGGLSLRSTQQTLGPNSYALFNADVGLVLTSDTGWRLGASYLNLPLGAKSSSAASAFRLGASYFHLAKKGFTALFAAAGSIEPHTGSRVQVGVEGGWNRSVFVRSGYEFNLQDRGLDQQAGFTAGAGLVLGPLRADYAYKPFGELGATHRVSVAYRFPPPKPTATPTPSPTPSPTPTPSGPPAAYLAPAPIVIAPPPSAPLTHSSEPTPETGVGADKPALTLEFELPSDEVAKGQQLEKEGKKEEAFKAYLAAVQKDRNNAKAWSALGTLYYKTGMKPQAVRCFEEVLRIRPDKADLAEWLKRYRNAP